MTKKEQKEFEMNLRIQSFDSLITLSNDKRFLNSLRKLNPTDLLNLYCQAHDIDGLTSLPDFHYKSLDLALSGSIEYLKKLKPISKPDVKLATRLKKKYDLTKMLES